MAGRDRQDDSDDSQLAAKRKSFVTNYTLTLALVALVLVVALAQSHAQDFSQAKRVLVAPDVATQNDQSGGANGSAYFASSRSQPSAKQQQQRATASAARSAARSQQAAESESTFSQPAGPDLGPVRTTRSSPVAAEELTSPSNARQTRGTTRRRSTSTTTTTSTPATTTSTTTTTTTPVPTTVFENEPPASPATTTAATLTTYSRPLADEANVSTRATNQRVRNADKRRNQSVANRLRADDERDLNLDDLDEVEAELEREREQDRLRQERRRLRHQRLRNRQQQLLAGSSNASTTLNSSAATSASTSAATSAEPPMTTKLQAATSGATSTRPPSTTPEYSANQQPASTTPRLASATTDQLKRYRQPQVLATTAAARSAIGAADHRLVPAVGGRAHNKTLSLLDHEYFDEDYDESPAAAGRLATSSTSAKKESSASSSEGGAGSATPPFVAPSSPSPSTVAASSESQTTQWINSLVSSLNGSLDARSPSGSLGRRLTNLITDPKSKQLPHRLSTSGQQQAGARGANATSSTTVAHFAGTTTRPQDAPPAAGATLLGGDNRTTSRLDWSKLVKVVFKSFEDNSTVHTVVLNSTELDNHPVQDWTAELPKLLRRDIENLLQKWSHVFPFDHLVSDLNQIISNKTATVANETSRVAINQPVDLASNGSLPAASSLAKFANSAANSSSTSLAQNRSAESPNTSTSQPSLYNTTAGKPELVNQWTTQLPGSDHSSGQNKTAAWWTSPLIKPTAINETTSPATGQQLGGSAGTNLTLTTATTARPLHATSSSSRSTGFNGNLFNRTHGFESLFTTTTRAPLFNSVKPKSRPREEAAKDLEEMVRDLRDEQTKIEDDVKEQGNSLRHFIIICSISVVLSTSLVVALIVLLFK